jgi:predicted phosphodiesterase
LVISICVCAAALIFTKVGDASAAGSSGEIPKLQIPVMSDIHINNQYETDLFKRALNDMKIAAPNYGAIALVGDITEWGATYQYDTFMRTLNENIKIGAEKIIAMGNHESAEIWYGSPDADRGYLNRFITKTGMPSVYYDKWISGYHFITLGGEVLANSNANDAILSENQYMWLEKSLPINADPKKPIFVFLHQPINKTVYGSEMWHGNLGDGRLYNILAKYPQVILFSGHSHNLLDHPRTVYQDKFTMVNTGSVQYTWFNGGYGPRGTSQGLLVNVYDNKVEIKSREFSTGTWLKTFTVKIPFEKTFYDDAKPSFGAGATVKIDSVNFENAVISFDPAIDNGQIDGYIIKCDGNEYNRIFREYWKGNSEERVKANIGDLIPGKKYRIEIYALDAWMNISDKPLEITIDVPVPKGWAMIKGKWYYYGENGGKKTGWLLDNNKWYYLSTEGQRVFGWLNYYGAWYYMNKDGTMATGWVYDGGKWYYLSPAGYMLRAWLQLNGIWYYFNPSGDMKTGWVRDNGYWYYLGEGGDMRKGWLLAGGNWYYFSPYGNMVTDWQIIGGKRYYFDTSGIWKKEKRL